jgi:hypothetical protein
LTAEPIPGAVAFQASELSRAETDEYIFKGFVTSAPLCEIVE